MEARNMYSFMCDILLVKGVYSQLSHAACLPTLDSASIEDYHLKQSLFLQLLKSHCISLKDRKLLQR